LAQDVKQLYELQQQVWDLRKVLFVGTSWMSAMKYTAQKLNLGSDKVSSPIEPLTAAEKRMIDAILAKYLNREGDDG
jgi:dihydrodipicolinate synthase/N-acetylneuraminate lyase